MRLVSVWLQGYKRFGDRSRLLVDGDVTALVGPNEAGKSAVLEALAHTETREPFAHHVLTRGAEPDDRDVVVELLYKLEPSDFDGISPVPETKPIWLELGFRRDGGSYVQVKPAVSRSRQLRPAAEEAISSLLGDVEKAVTAERNAREADEQEESDETPEPTPLERLAALLEGLKGKVDVDQDDLPEEVQTQLSDAVELLDSADVEVELEHPEARTSFGAAAKHESDNHLLTLGRALAAKRPAFLYINQDARQLAGSYSIPEIEANHHFPALHNLARTGGISITDYIEANRSNPARAKGLERSASEQISRRLTAAWDQAEDLRVDFEIHTGDTLSILISTSGAAGFHEASERSAGMRAFIALVSAIDAARAEDSDRPVILLLEHPEHDLHIDAQADLIRVLEEQREAQQVIYTTHSPAALPTDIAPNTRAVVRRDSEGHPDRSRFAASFAEDDAGFTPLQLVMGAGTAAFTPARRAVIGEGLTEVYLVPAICREVSGLHRLPFQVAPGGAYMSRETALRVNSDAAHVAFLVDGDRAGQKIANRIVGAGVSQEHVIILGGEGSDLDIEDLIDRDLYLDAVNEELRLKAAGFEIAAEDLEGEGDGRIDSVKRVCEAHEAPPPEPAVARRCLDFWEEARRDPQTDDRPFVAADMQETARDMLEKLLTIVDPRP